MDNNAYSPSDPEWTPRFLEALRAGGTIRYACALAGVSRRTALEARKRSPTFAHNWDDALADYTDLLVGRVTQLAMERGDKDMMRLALQIYLPHLFGRGNSAAAPTTQNVLMIGPDTADVLRQTLESKLLPKANVIDGDVVKRSG